MMHTPAHKQQPKAVPNAATYKPAHGGYPSTVPQQRARALPTEPAPRVLPRLPGEYDEGY